MSSSTPASVSRFSSSSGFEKAAVLLEFVAELLILQGGLALVGQLIESVLLLADPEIGLLDPVFDGLQLLVGGLLLRRIRRRPRSRR